MSDPIRVGGGHLVCDVCGGSYHASEVHDCTTLAAEVIRLNARIAALEAERAEIEAACYEVAQDNSPKAVGTPDPDLAKYVVMNENGDPRIEVDTPAELIRALNTMWGRVSDQLDEREAERNKLARVSPDAHNGDVTPTEDSNDPMYREQLEEANAELARLRDVARRGRNEYRHELETALDAVTARHAMIERVPNENGPHRWWFYLREPGDSGGVGTMYSSPVDALLNWYHSRGSQGPDSSATTEG